MISRYMSAPRNLHNIVSAFQEWSGLKISIKKSLSTGAVYGKGEAKTQKDASAVARKRKPTRQPYRTSEAVLQTTQDLENIHSDSAGKVDSKDEEVLTACDELASHRLLQRCEICGRNRNPHHFKSASKTQCTQCFKSWTTSSIRYQGKDLKTIHGRTPIRLLGIHHNMWLDVKS